jgi:hypothetical protein
VNPEKWALAATLAALVGCSRQPTQPSGHPSVPTAKQLVVSPGLVVERACTPTGPELCFNARDDNCNGVIDEGCGVHTGLVQFVVAWDAPKADVDLHVTDPNGELIEVGSTAESGLVKDRDCPGRQNACYGQNLENVYLEEGDPLRGSYQVRVRLEKLGGANPPIRVTLGARVGPKTYAVQFDLAEPAQERRLTLEL